MAAQEYLVDALNVHVYDTRDQMGQASANDAIRFLKEVLCHQATANVMFGAAPSQNEMLAAMLRSDLDWSRINAFHMDEYIGLAQQHPAGFGNFLRRSLFDHVPLRQTSGIPKRSRLLSWIKPAGCSRSMMAAFPLFLRFPLTP